MNSLLQQKALDEAQQEAMHLPISKKPVEVKRIQNRTRIGVDFQK